MCRLAPVSIPCRRIGRQSLAGAATLDLGIVTTCSEFGNSCRIGSGEPWQQGSSILPNPPVITVVDDDEAMRDAFCDLLQVLAMSCRAFDRAEALLAAYAPGENSEPPRGCRGDSANASERWAAELLVVFVAAANRWSLRSHSGTEAQYLSCGDIASREKAEVDCTSCAGARGSHRAHRGSAPFHGRRLDVLVGAQCVVLAVATRLECSGGCFCIPAWLARQERVRSRVRGSIAWQRDGPMPRCNQSFGEGFPPCPSKAKRRQARGASRLRLLAPIRRHPPRRLPIPGWLSRQRSRRPRGGKKCCWEEGAPWSWWRSLRLAFRGSGRLSTPFRPTTHS